MNTINSRIGYSTRKPFLLILLACIYIHAYSQEIVHLKNGSIIKGSVVEQIPNQYIKIQSGDGSVFVYQSDEISKIEKAVKKNRFKSYLSKEYDITGYRGFVDIGFQRGLDLSVHDFSCFIISTSHGYQFSQLTFLGIGVGYNEYAFPIFVDYRQNFIKGSISPFFNMKAGLMYSISHAKPSHEGYYLLPAFGCKFMVSDKVAANISVGYNCSFAKMYEWDYETHERETKYNNFGGLSCQIGFEF